MPCLPTWTKDKIEAVKEYITNANDKDLRGCSRRISQKPSTFLWCSKDGNTKTQLAGIKGVFHIALTMGYVKRNILPRMQPNPSENNTYPNGELYGHRYRAGRSVQHDGAGACLRLYQFLTTFTVPQSGPDKASPHWTATYAFDKDFIRAVMRADYSTAYQKCVKGKMRCVITCCQKPISRTGRSTAQPQPVPGLTAKTLQVQ